MSSLVDSRPSAASAVQGWQWPPVQRRELTVLAAICVGLLVVGLVLISQGAPLGHDESVYALRARFWAGQAQDVAWNDYRAEGLPFLTAPLVMLGASEPQLRATVLVFAVVMVVLTWALARLLFDERTGLLGAALTALAPATLAWGWQIALDVPSAALGLAATLVFATAVGGERVRWWAVAAVPLAIAAVYVRYGAPLVVASGMVGIAVARWRVMWRDRWRVAALGAATVAGMAAVLLVPALTNSRQSPGLAFRARQVQKEIGAFESYGDFVGVLDDVFGPVVGLLLVVGVVSAVVRRRSLPTTSLVASGTATVLFIVGINFSLAQMFSQYLIPLVPFISVVAAAGLASLLSTRRVVAAVVTGLLVVGVVPTWVAGQAAVDTYQEWYGVIRHVAREIDETTDGPCVVVTGYSPQVGWYSRCSAYGFTTPMREGGLTRSAVLSHAHRFVPPGSPAFAVLFNRGKRQPSEEGIADMYSYARSTREFGDVDDGKRQWGQIIDLGPTP